MQGGVEGVVLEIEKPVGIEENEGESRGGIAFFM